MADKDFDELKESMNVITTDIAIMSNELKRLADTTKKLVEVSTKTNIVIERTNENDKKISILFKKYDDMYEKGTKNCPVNVQRIDGIDGKNKDTNSRIDTTNKWLVGTLITVSIQLVVIIIQLIGKYHL